MRLELAPLLDETLDDSHVEGLVSHAKAFKKLKALDLSENFFTKAGIAALQKAFPYLQAKEQKSPWEDDPDFRYVSVGE